MALRIQNEEIVYGNKLGEGGFGVVYKAIWNHVDVAVKRLVLSNLSAPMNQDFEKEIKMHIGLRHPHIVQIYGVTSEQPYGMVMEYMENGSLASYLRKDPQKNVISWSLKYKIALDVSKGLSFLHSIKIIHRDLKSLNILISRNLDAKIADFGLAKLKEETKSCTQQKSGFKGTILWAAPELFKLDPVYNAKTDIYSLGIVQWELASHEYPYKEAGVYAIATLVMNGTRETFPENTPEDFAELAKKCWDGKAENRPELESVIVTLESLLASSNESKYASSYLSSSTPNQSYKNDYLQSTTKSVESVGYLNPFAESTGNLFQPEKPRLSNPHPISIAIPPTPLLALPSCAFGAAQWNKYFGDVGVEPSLPKDIHQILQGPCPIWPDKTVQETHLLTLIPATVNKQPFILKTLGELVKHPKTGPATEFKRLDLGEYRDNPVPQSYWILMSRDVLEGSHKETYKTQFAQVASLAQKTGLPYAAPKVLEVATCILMHHVSTGEKLYKFSPYRFTRCQEFYSQKNDKKLLVGRFGSDGLDVSIGFSHIPSIGVAACRRF